MKPPTEKQYRLLRCLGSGDIALAPTRGDWKPLLRREWVECMSEDDGKGYLPPVRITAAGLRALAAAVEAYGLPEITNREGLHQRKEHPAITEIKARLESNRELLRESERERHRIEMILRRTRRVIEGGYA